MKQKFVVQAEGVTAIVIVNPPRAAELTRVEQRHIRDEAADRIMQALVGLSYISTPLSRIRVR